MQKTNVLLLDKKEIDQLDELREKYKASEKHSFYLVACNFRELEQRDFPDGAIIYRFSVNTGATSLEKEDKELLVKTVEKLIDLENPQPSKGEFTKLSTKEGELIYISKYSPNHDKLVEDWIRRSSSI